MREQGPRLIGNVAIEVDLGAGPQVLAGFENHGGRTQLGSGASPLGRVLKGHGNNGQDGREGVRGGARGTVRGHLSPRSVASQERVVRRLADRDRAGPRRRASLPPLDDALEDAAHAGARRAAGL